MLLERGCGGVKGRLIARVLAVAARVASLGLRAEQIRAALKMQSKEMPRVLQEGLAKEKLKSKGQKRATMYFAAA